MNLDLMFSSKTDCWATPPDFFEKLNAEFGFELDVCALPENAKCSRYFTPEVDGLTQAWRGVCWMNPPYGREMGKWVRKAYESSRAGRNCGLSITCPDRHALLHEYCMKGEIRFIRGRLKFGGHSNAAPFPSAVVVFRPEHAEVAA